MSNNTPSKCYLFSCEPNKTFCHTLQITHKAFCHTMYAAHTTQRCSNTPYALCTSDMQYFIILSVHQNFNSCINPTSLIDMPIPAGTFHRMSTYATHTHTYIYVYTHIYSIMFCKALSILSLHIPIFLQHLTS
jgi:hypothetical protein